MYGKSATVRGKVGVIVSVSATHYGVRFIDREIIYYLITNFRDADAATPDSSKEGNTDA